MIDITKDEMNILNLNGMSVQDVQNYVDDCYRDDLSDEQIRAQFDSIISNLKPTTPLNAEITDNIPNWQNKPPIGAFEFAKMNTYTPVPTRKTQLKNDFENNKLSQNNFAPVPAPPPDIAKGISDAINDIGADIGKWWVYKGLNKGIYETKNKPDKIGFFEAANDARKQGTALPFLGGYIQGAQKEIVMEISDKISRGENLTADEAFAFQSLLSKTAEERMRGYSIMGGIGNTFLPSLIRFSGEMAATGAALKGAGLVSNLPKEASNFQKIKAGLKDMPAYGILGTVLNPSEQYAAYENRDFQNRMKLTPEGEIYFAESLEKPATTFLKSMGDVALTFASEASGLMLGGIAGSAFNGVKKLSSPLTQYLAKNKNLRTLINDTIPKLLEKAKDADKLFDKTRYIADRVKFDGLLEEIGEEKLEDILSLTFGLQDEKPTLENYAKTFFASPDEWAVLVGSVLLQGGTLSLTSNLLAKTLRNNGMNDADIQNVVSSLSQTEQKDVIKDLIDKGVIDAALPEKIQNDAFWDDFKNQRYSLHINEGMSEDMAKMAASLDSIFGAKTAEMFDLSDDEAADFLPSFKSEELRQDLSSAINKKRFEKQIKEDLSDYDNLAEYLSKIDDPNLENFSTKEKYDFAVNHALQNYDNRINSQNIQENNNTLIGNVQYNTLSEQDIETLTNELANIDDEAAVAFFKALDGNADSNDISLLKNAVNQVSDPSALQFLIDNRIKNEGVPSGTKTTFSDIALIDIIADVQPNFKSKTINNVYFQSAMYKSPLENFQDFYNQVFEKENNAKHKGEKLKKSYFEYNDNNVCVRIKHDAVKHGDKKHQLSVNEWNEVLTNILNIENAKISNETFSNDEVALLKINTPIGKYGVAIQFANGSNYVATAFKSTDLGIDTWIEKGSAKMLSNNPIAPLEENSSASDVILSQNPNNIINYIKEKLNPSNQQSEKEVYYQSANIDDRHILYEKIINTEKYKNLPENIKNTVDFIFTAEPVAEVKGDEFPNNGENLNQRILNYYTEKYNNIVNVEGFGDIILDERSIKDSAYQGLSNNKVNAFAIVPDVLLKGTNLNTKVKYKGKNEDRYVFVAPITIKGENYFCEVVVKNTDKSGNQNGKQRFYLHEVEITKKLADVFTAPQGGTSASSKSIIADLINDLNPITKIYYQSAYHGTPNRFDEFSPAKNVVNLTNDFDKTPTIDEVKNYINEIIEQGTKFATLSPDWFVDIKGGNRVKKKLRNDGNYKKLDKKEIVRHNKYILSLEKLLNNAEYIGEKENTKKDKKPNVAKYHYFKTNAKIGDKIYEIIFDTEAYKNDNPPTAQHAKRALKPLPEDTNSITNFNNDFYPKTVHLYNINEFKKPQIYYQSTSKIIEPQINYGNKPHKGFYIPGIQEIFLNGQADVTTVIHEYAHWYLDTLARFEGYSDKVDDALFVIRKYLNIDTDIEQGKLLNVPTFTEVHHEKFAKSFERYIYTGNAKNSKLRKIYDDAKALLHNIYEDILQGNYFIGGKVPITPDDEKHIKNVFDTILKIDNERLHNQVYKKIDNLNQIIADIKNNQKEEIAEIWDYHNQIKEKIQTAGKINKDVKSLLNDAEKFADKKENLRWREYNKKRQETAWNIIADAVGMPVKETKQKWHSKHAKTREDIQLKVREVSDKLSAGDLYTDENVKEFFGQIDMNEINASQLLVDAAVNAVDTYISFDTPLDTDINNFLNRFDYLKKQAQKSQGIQNTTAIEAIFDLMNDADLNKLPAAFLEDIGKDVMNFCEKNDEKFDRKASNKDYALFYQGLLHSKLKKIKLYNSQEKHAVKLSSTHAFYVKVPLATKASKAENIIREINSAIIRDCETRKNAIIAKEINKQLKINSKILYSKSRVKRGLYDWRTNSLFSELTELNKMNLQNLNSEINKLISPEAQNLLNQDIEIQDNPNKDEDKKSVDFDFARKLKKKFITYKLSANLENVDSALMLDLLGDILELKEKARNAKSKEELDKKLQKYNFRNDLAERIRNNDSKIKKLIKHLYDNPSQINLNTILRICFGNDAVEKYGLLNEEIEKVMYEFRHLKNFYNKALKCYNIKNPSILAKALWDPHGIGRLQKMFRDYQNELFDVQETIFDYMTKENLTSMIQLDRAQTIVLYAWNKNKLLAKRLDYQFGQEQLNYLFGKLSEEDKQFAGILMDTCAALKDDVNEIMIRTQGLAMETVENYLPSVVRRRGDAINNAALINTRIGQPSPTKSRVKSPLIAMRPVNPLTLITKHIDMMSSYVCVSEKAAFVSEIFGSPDLQRAFENAFDESYSYMLKRTKNNKDCKKDIENHSEKSPQKSNIGNKIYGLFAEQIAASTFFKYCQSVKTISDWENKLIDNFIVGAIGASPKIAMGQLLSVINYSDGSDITFKDWALNFSNCMQHPWETFEFMKQDEYLQARFFGNLQNETMQALLQEFDKWKDAKTLFTSNVRYGDILAIIFGGKPYIDSLMQQGVSKEEAFKRFRIKTNEAQQSSLPSTISNIQRSSRASVWNGLMLAFSNTPHQYERKTLEALADLARGVNKNTAIKNLIIYRVVSPLLFDFIFNQLGLYLLFGDDDDNRKDAILGAITSLLLGNSAAYLLKGFFVSASVHLISDAIKGEYSLAYFSKIPVLADFEKQFAVVCKEISKKGLKTETLIKSIALSLHAGRGIPAPKVLNSFGGIADIKDGKILKGFHKAAGWGDYATEKAFGN